MKLSTFIDARLKHSDCVIIKTITNQVLYMGLVADIPYRLAVKSDFLDASLSINSAIIHVIYRNN